MSEVQFLRHPLSQMLYVKTSWNLGSDVTWPHTQSANFNVRIDNWIEFYRHKQKQIWKNDQEVHLPPSRLPYQWTDVIQKLATLPLHPCLPFSQRTLAARCTGGHRVRARAVVAHIQWKTVRSSCEILYLAPSTAASTPSVALLPSTGPIPPLQLLSCLLCNGLHVFTHILG